MFMRHWGSRDRTAHRVEKRVRPGGGSFRSKALPPPPSVPAKVDSPMLGMVVGAMSAKASPRGGAVGVVTTVAVGAGQRMFAAHADVLAASPVLGAACRDVFHASPVLSPSASPALSSPDTRGFALPEEDPQVFACVLEYLYKGDYQPRLVADPGRNTWVLEDSATDLREGRGGGGGGGLRPSGCGCGCGGHSSSGACLSGPRAVVGATVMTADAKALGGPVLRDTAVYCAAVRYDLPELARLALRKQSLLTGVDVALVLRSMRFAYAHTPAADSRLRAHYLALIIRCRRTFKRSGTMQHEMARGGAMFFDLFVAMCNHMDDLADEAGRGRQAV